MEEEGLIKKKRGKEREGRVPHTVIIIVYYSFRLFHKCTDMIVTVHTSLH